MAFVTDAIFAVSLDQGLILAIKISDPDFFPYNSENFELAEFLEFASKIGPDFLEQILEKNPEIFDSNTISENNKFGHNSRIFFVFYVGRIKLVKELLGSVMRVFIVFGYKYLKY